MRGTALALAAIALAALGGVAAIAVLPPTPHTEECTAHDTVPGMLYWEAIDGFVMTTCNPQLHDCDAPDHVVRGVNYWEVASGKDAKVVCDVWPEEGEDDGHWGTDDFSSISSSMDDDSLQDSVDWCGALCGDHMQGDGVCDEACLTAACSYDCGANGVCDCTGFDQDGLQCAVGCSQWMIGDGECHSVCDVSGCSNDGGDCLCAPGCEDAEIGDEVCNPECMTAACGNDGGDCDLCADGCTPFMLGDHVCHEACDNVACGFDAEDCLTCAQDCPLWMLGNGNCDDACANANCDQDGGDCVSDCDEPCPEDTVPGDGFCPCDIASCAPGCPLDWVADGICDTSKL